MRAIIQRVRSASVDVSGSTTGAINTGILILLGITHDDSEADALALRDKILKLRIFPAPDGSSGFDRSVVQVGGAVLIVSQFTLYASTRKGRRPGFSDAAPPEHSNTLYQRTVNLFRETGIQVETGQFGAMMVVSLQNDGPATFILDTRQE